MSDGINQSSLGGRYLCFKLGAENFALPLLCIKEVIGNVKTTPIPQAPPYFKGLIDLRGDTISIFDLRLKLKVGKAETTQETTVIILNFDSMSLGATVDSVQSVLSFSAEDISPAPYTESKDKTSFVTGVAKHENSLVLILDPTQIFSSEDFKRVKTAS